MLPDPRGGNLAERAVALGIHQARLLDASASLAPLGPWVAWLAGMAGASLGGFRPYPDRAQALRQAIGGIHGLDCSMVLPGNGAAELFTWAGRDSSAVGLSAIPAPGFVDYRRALDCWDGAWEPWPLPLSWDGRFPQCFPNPPPWADVLWITNPHNPTGQLWSRESLEPLIERYALVICDVAFLPLVPGGELQSLIPLVQEYALLVVIRSLTKLYGFAGLRLGYAIGQPDRLQRWAAWRDPWPVNGLAAAIGERLLADPSRYQRHCQGVQRRLGNRRLLRAFQYCWLEGLGFANG